MNRLVAEPSLPRKWLAYPTGDSLLIAGINLVIAGVVRFLGARGMDVDGLLNGGTALFVTPVLAALTLLFAVRDVRQGKQKDVIYATILTFLALYVAWWPLLEAD